LCTEELSAAIVFPLSEEISFQFIIEHVVLVGVDDGGSAQMQDPWILAVVQVHVTMEMKPWFILFEKFSKYLEPLMGPLQIA
jgi:hypothetical protein